MSLLEAPAALALRRIGLEQLARARRHRARLGDPSYPDALHDLRVALRRLRSLLRAGEPVLAEWIRPKDRKALDRLQRASGRSRNLEVELAWLADEFPSANLRDPRLDPLLGRLRREAAAEHRSARRLLDRHFQRVVGRLEERLSAIADAPRGDPARSYGRVLADSGDAAVAVLRTRLARAGVPPTPAGLHRVRIACKRLRYLYEPARRELPASRTIVARSKPLQEALGDLNDVFVISSELAGRAERWPAHRAACRLVSRRLARREARLLARLERDDALANAHALCELVLEANRQLRTGLLPTPLLRFPAPGPRPPT